MLDYCVKTWGVNDIRIQKDEVSTVCRSYPFHSSIPPLYRPPFAVPSVRSVIPSALLPLSGFGQSLADPDKRTLPVMEKEQRSWLSGGGGGGGAGAGQVGQALSKLWLSVVVFLDPLLIRRLTRPVSAEISRFPPPSTFFPGPPSFSGVRDENVKKKKNRGNAADAWHEAVSLLSGVVAVSSVAIHTVRSSHRCWLLILLQLNSNIVKV